MRPEYSGAAFCGWKAQKNRQSFALAAKLGRCRRTRPFPKNPAQATDQGNDGLRSSLLQIGHPLTNPHWTVPYVPESGDLRLHLRNSSCHPTGFLSHRIFHSAPGFLHKIHELNMRKGPGSSEWHCSRIVEHRGRFTESRHEACGLPEAPRTTWHQGLAEDDLRLGMRLAGVRR